MKYIKQCVTTMYKDYEDKGGDDECAICLEQYEEDDVILVYSCDSKHYFHMVCGSEWLKLR